MINPLKWRESWEELGEEFEGIRKIRRKRISKGRIKASTRRAKRTAKRLTKRYKRVPKIAKRQIQKMELVISARGRPLGVAGQPIPFAPPAPGMPVSKQDYFLTSRAIMKASWDPNKKLMELKFVTGAVYQYRNINEQIWLAFINAGSKGRFFIYRIRPFPKKYPYTRVG